MSQFVLTYCRSSAVCAAFPSGFQECPNFSEGTDTMSASLPGGRELPVSQYDLSSYWGRVRHAADISDPR